MFKWKVNNPGPTVGASKDSAATGGKEEKDNKKTKLNNQEANSAENNNSDSNMKNGKKDSSNSKKDENNAQASSNSSPVKSGGLRSLFSSSKDSNKNSSAQQQPPNNQQQPPQNNQTKAEIHAEVKPINTNQVPTTSSQQPNINQNQQQQLATTAGKMLGVANGQHPPVPVGQPVSPPMVPNGQMPNFQQQQMGNLPKQGWRPQYPNGQQQMGQQIYGQHNPNPVPFNVNSLQNTNLANWSSHGYLSKQQIMNGVQTMPNPHHQNGQQQMQHMNGQMTMPNGQHQQMHMNLPNGQLTDQGYILLKRQGDGQMVTVKSPPTQQRKFPTTQQIIPQQLPQQQPFMEEMTNPMTGERKYFSVKGFGDLRQKMVNGNNQDPNQQGNQQQAQMDKYYSVDSRFQGGLQNQIPPDLRAKLRQVQQQQQFNKPPQTQQQQPNSNLAKSKEMSSSVSWLEWTQQLQAYVAWVNSQLRKRPDLKPVQDLRTDLQSGEVLAQLIEIISGDKITGVQYNPESIQGMRENLDRILQFMAVKRIRMHQITSKEILEGNLKAVMRLILALAAHYKPQSVRHHDVSYESIDDNSTSRHNTSQPIEALTKTAPPQPNARQVKSTSKLLESSSSNHKPPHNPPPPKVQHKRESSISDSLNRTIDTSVLSASSMAEFNNTVIKRTPSMNAKPMSANIFNKPKQPDLMNESTNDLYENVTSPPVTKASMSIQTDAKSVLQNSPAKNGNSGGMPPPIIQRESSFIRTGSGRKLPKIPASKILTSNSNGEPIISTANSGNQASIIPENSLREKMENRKSKPKALEFWESLTQLDKHGNEESDEIMIQENLENENFKYNTIHRMSVQNTGSSRRMLPKPPMNKAAARSQSLDRSGGEIAARLISNGMKLRFEDEDDYEEENDNAENEGQQDIHQQFNASFSGPSSLPVEHQAERGRSRFPDAKLVVVSPNPRGSTNTNTVGSDGCSQEESSEEEVNHKTSQGQSSPQVSSSSRGEVEGSSDNNSPPTSVIRGNGRSAVDWHKTQNMSLDEELYLLRSLRAGSNGPMDMGSDSGKGHSPPLTLQNNTGAMKNKEMENSSTSGKDIPYEVLLRDLNQAKRQLLELHSLEVESAKYPQQQPNNGGSPQELSRVKQNLVRMTLAKQNLEGEKRTLLARVTELETAVIGGANSSASNGNQKSSSSVQGSMSSLNNGIYGMLKSNQLESELKAIYDEELAVAKDAIGNLRTSFKDSDPNQHILDTLEQCISVIVEKMQHLEHKSSSSLSQHQQSSTNQEKAQNSGRFSSMDYGRNAEDGHQSRQSNQSSMSINTTSSQQQGSPTKILYFTNRSVTPFMVSIGKKIGEVTLRDFKNLYDRPGFYRFHFKTVDQEFGMVKEEITNDDTVLPGADGKIVVWVDEE